MTRNHASVSAPAETGQPWNELPADTHTPIRPILIASAARLIANETHSRKESSASKQSTYEILIANEFHCAASVFRRRAGLAKLGFSPSLTKHSTSHFLINNLNGCSVKPFTLSAVEGSRPPQQLAAKSHRTSAIELRTSSNLIENDMHSRETSSHCKRSTYKILIDNEFHRASLDFSALQRSPTACLPSADSAKHGPSLPPSDRQYEILELLLTHRKQRTGKFLIAKFRHILWPNWPSRSTTNSPASCFIE